MPLPPIRRVALAFVAAMLLAAPAAAQNVPPLQTPDVTNLIAPGSDGTPAAAPGAAAPATPTTAPDVTTDTSAGPCGNQPITIARMAWPSAALLAEIHARILKQQFECTVDVQPTDLAPAISGMAATGQPALAPEMWVSRVADLWNQAVKDEKLRQVGLSYVESQFEGWYVPDYVMAAHPELKSATALKDDFKLFANGGEKGKLISCPADWACAIVNRNLLKAEGLDQLFDVVEPKNRFELDQTIAEAVGRKEPILFYYWQPNATLAQFSFKPVDLGAYSKDDFACLGKKLCDEPKPSSFAPEPVVIALAEWVFTGAPEVAAYFQRAQMPMDVMNGLLAQLNVAGASPESVADSFVADRKDIWGKWVGTPAAAAPAAGAAAPGAAGTTPSAAPVIDGDAPVAPVRPRRQPAQQPQQTTPIFIEPIIKY